MLTDQSSSLLPYVEIRDAALRQVLAWTPANLRGDDQVTVVAFAGDAATVMPLTTIAQRPTLDPPPTNLTDGTRLSPALRELRHQPRPAGRAGLIVISPTVSSTTRP